MDWYLILGGILGVICTAGGLIFGVKVLKRFKKIEKEIEEIKEK